MNASVVAPSKLVQTSFPVIQRLDFGLERSFGGGGWGVRFVVLSLIMLFVLRLGDGLFFRGWGRGFMVGR